MMASTNLGGDTESDADSDLDKLQNDMVKLDESVRSFLASHGGLDQEAHAMRGGTRGRGTRGPRKAAKPRGDITTRLFKINRAFVSGDYERALDLALEVIRINAETYQAWTTLSSILSARGEADQALATMVYAAHLRPKDVTAWLKSATLALDAVEQVGQDRADVDKMLQVARTCFSAALRADPTHVEARLGKAAVCHRQGHLAAAIAEYKVVLKHRPQDAEVVRKLAAACLGSRNAEANISVAIEAYRRFFRLEKQAQARDYPQDLWAHVGIYAGLFAACGCPREAIGELKSLSRWLVGRGSEDYWKTWQQDDREWDADDQRRISVPEYDSSKASPSLHGNCLPMHLRIRLSTYRLRLGDECEALRHLSWLNTKEDKTKEIVGDCSLVVYELATELATCGQTSRAIELFQLLLSIPGEADASTLLQLGRCHQTLGQQPVAEEYFLAAIDVDQDNIDARVALANMYEKAREDEEALILAAEALALQEARGQPHAMDSEGPNMNVRLGKQRYGDRRRASAPSSTKSKPSRPSKDSVVPRRYRPKRLAGPDMRLRDEQARALKLLNQFKHVRDLKNKIAAGHGHLVPLWMAMSKELVDDFRYLKRFYTWDKYLRCIGPSPINGIGQRDGDSELSQMYERLSRSVAPQADHSASTCSSSNLHAHRGIAFEDWLDLFLDYAIGLALAHRREEAYSICQAAKDSTVFQEPQHNFFIYLAWSVCAIYTNDEERCVATARHLMSDGALSDSCRMFALLSRLCQSPVSWYTSGPAQKFIMRQIKAIDTRHGLSVSSSPSDASFDVCLLMLYGHILFTSTSYTYSLGYFLRARALDPTNSMINLSLGLAYVHSGLKRQSTNRQYLLLQGQSFISLYLNARDKEHDGEMAERLYNVGRLFQLLGISYLSSRYYVQALDVYDQGGGTKDLSTCILINTIFSHISVRNNAIALALIKSQLHI
ncbi:hypothetical protein CDD81_4805 [Ophiocordyceps australis]|uniref:Uncharacterized protein n=1 Tax=Ophiocordyceps australis TaxID=1399860 RepID=A0A2C5XQG9_9HYPO|nr:hypothetical protein CDD81_4805 [Ophiocordyceps australis]